MRETCTNCKSTDIELLIDKGDILWEGQYLNMDVDYSVCAKCGYEFISTEQIKINDARIKAINMQYDLTCEHRLQEGGMCEDCDKSMRDNSMDFSIALALLKQGVQVARLAWESGFIELYQGRIRFCTQEPQAETFYWSSSGNDEDLLATDWVIVE